MVATEQKVHKNIVRAGLTPVPPKPDTKVKFFYKVSKVSDGSVLDDNHDTEPLELVYGKQFKLEIWEDCLKTMQLQEVAQFTVAKDLLASYPLVAKSLRDIAKDHDPHHCGHEEEHASASHGCCGMQKLLKNGLGYADLDALMTQPEDLQFTFELVEAHEPGSYEKDQWAMDAVEKLSSVPRLHAEGNHLYTKQKYVEAADRYSCALAALEDLQNKEQPESEEWRKLDGLMRPLLLNYVQCQLILGHYSEAIQHASTIIEREPGNVKAWFRRAKAHVMAWNPKEAREDFAKAVELDAGLEKTVAKELRDLDRMQKQRDVEDREKMRHLFG